MLQKVTRLDSVPTAEETVLTTEVPTKESRLYTLLVFSERWSVTIKKEQETTRRSDRNRRKTRKNVRKNEDKYKN